MNQYQASVVGDIGDRLRAAGFIVGSGDGQCAEASRQIEAFDEFLRNISSVTLKATTAAYGLNSLGRTLFGGVKFSTTKFDVQDFEHCWRSLDQAYALHGIKLSKVSGCHLFLAVDSKAQGMPDLEDCFDRFEEIGEYLVSIFLDRQHMSVLGKKLFDMGSATVGSTLCFITHEPSDIFLAAAERRGLRHDTMKSKLTERLKNPRKLMEMTRSFLRQQVVVFNPATRRAKSNRWLQPQLVYGFQSSEVFY